MRAFANKSSKTRHSVKLPAMPATGVRFIGPPMRPLSVLLGMNNAAASHISLEYRLQGPNITYSTATWVYHNPLLTNTAAALSEAQIGAIRKSFPQATLFSMYGLTECKRCTYLPPEDLARKPESVGVPIPNTEIWIVDEQGNKLGATQVGQLVVRGATVMKGYWQKPEATARRLKPGPLPGEQVCDPAAVQAYKPRAE